MIVCVALSPSLDVTYRVEALRVGEISRPSAVQKVAGGKGLNVARSAARLGAPVRAVAVLGGRTGEQVSDLLAGSGVELTAVPVVGETRTCVSIAASDDERMTEIYESALPLDDVAWVAVLTQLESLQSEDWVVLSGSVPLGITPEQVSSLVEVVHASGARIAVDTHGVALAKLLDAGPDLVKVNRSEAAEVIGDSTASAIDLARSLRRRTGGTVVVTDGVDGSSAIDQDGVVRVPGESIRGRFPVGSGDSYTAGVVVGLSEGMALRDAVHLGAACATANSEVPGAGQWSVDAMWVARARIRARVRPSGRVRRDIDG